MIRWLLALLSVTLLGSPQVYAARPDCERYSEVRRVVDDYYRVAKTDTGSLRSAMSEMLKEPVGATCWLIRDLGVLKREKLTATQALSSKPVWALRGLRFLTNCTEFRGSLTRKLHIDPQDIRWQLLLQNGVERVPFFRTWMARDVVVVAPVVVQQQIIAAWQDWYVSKASTFSYQPCSSTDAWYF